MKLPKLVHSSQFIGEKKSINQEPQTTNRKSLGFTLIELLVVISIIGVLAAIATASFTNAQAKARDGKRKTDLKAVQQALDTFYQTNSGYPRYSLSLWISCYDGITKIAWGTTFTCAGITYMNPLPKEISGWRQYLYVSRNYFSDPSLPNSQTYELYARLENANDADAYPMGTVPSQCLTTAIPAGLINTTGSTWNYCVTNP